MIPELLMPAGDLEKARIAYQFGADACYGSTSAFSMRTREIGFDYKTLKEAVDYAHSIRKKFYITCNVFPHELEIKNIKAHIKKLVSMHPDAIIIADPGILQIVTKELKNIKTKIQGSSSLQGGRSLEYSGQAPQSSNLTIQQFNNIEIHLSTQANATNSEAIKFWARQGVSRIILPRELSIKEITEIRRHVPKTIVLEAFVHGAMCNSVSGRCNLSNYLSYRDANRGACVQACRWKYALVEEKRPNQFIPVDEDSVGSYIYNSKDLNMIEHLDKLRDAGIESFKIEGRNKSIYYAAIVARAYHKAIDKMAKGFGIKDSELSELRKELGTVTSRGYSTGFYFGNPTDADINYQTSRPTSDWQFAGVVKKKLKCRPGRSERSHHQKDIPATPQNDNLYLVECRNEIKKDSWVEIVTPNKIFRKKITKFISPTGEELEKVNPNDQFILLSKALLDKNSMIRLKK